MDETVRVTNDLGEGLGGFGAKALLFEHKMPGAL